jgi:hypothetical protein
MLPPAATDSGLIHVQPLQRAMKVSARDELCLRNAGRARAEPMPAAPRRYIVRVEVSVNGSGVIATIADTGSRP